MLNKSKGNMYGIVTHTWNPVKGACPHGCKYCYMTRYGTRQKPARFVEKELRDNLGVENIIFVGSSCDVFATAFPDEWIDKTLEHCRKYNDNRYLFQSKNPSRFDLLNFKNLPVDVILATTIETNRRYPEMGVAPSIDQRVSGLMQAKARLECRTMITIEPIMDFDLQDMVDIIIECQPSLIHIGANTHPKVNVSEPSTKKISTLIKQAKEVTEVHVKPNLLRLIK